MSVCVSVCVSVCTPMQAAPQATATSMGHGFLQALSQAYQQPNFTHSIDSALSQSVATMDTSANV